MRHNSVAVSTTTARATDDSAVENGEAVADAAVVDTVTAGPGLSRLQLVTTTLTAVEESKSDVAAAAMGKSSVSKKPSDNRSSSVR
jgi:hypothetical protein